MGAQRGRDGKATGRSPLQGLLMFNRLINQYNFSGFPRVVWAVAAMSVVSGTGFAVSFAFLPLYLYQERGLAMTLVGVFQLAGGVTSSLFQIVGGYLGDRFGHRRVALSFSFASVTVTAALAVSVLLQAPVWVVLLAAGLRQTLGSGGGPSMNAIIANASSKERMTESYSLLAMIGNIAWAVGPLLGGFLLGFASFAWLFGLGAGLSGLGLIGFRFVPSDSQPGDPKDGHSHAFKSLIPNSTLLLFGMGVLFFFLTLAQWGGTLSVFSIDRIGFTTAQYGLLMSISSILIIVFQYPISHRMAGRDRMSLVLGCLFYAFGFLSLAWVRSFIPAFGFVVVAVIGEMLFVPTAIAVVGRLSHVEDRGKSMGFYGLCTTMGISTGPLVGGFLLDRYPKTPLFLWGPISLFSFAAAFSFMIWKGYKQREVNEDYNSA